MMYAFKVTCILILCLCVHVISIHKPSDPNYYKPLGHPVIDECSYVAFRYTSPISGLDDIAFKIYTKENGEMFDTLVPLDPLEFNYLYCFTDDCEFANNIWHRIALVDEILNQTGRCTEIKIKEDA